MEIGLKNWIVWEISMGKKTVFNQGVEMILSREVRKKKQGFTVWEIGILLSFEWNNVNTTNFEVLLGCFRDTDP